MVKSTIKLPDGTTITIEGSPEELKKVLSVYQGQNTSNVGKEQKPVSEKKINKSSKQPKTTEDKTSKKDLIVELVNAIKNADDMDEIEKKILDKASQVDRVILPLFIMGRDLDNQISLTSNDIYKVLKELGISMALPNISKTLRGTALKYVIADKVTKKGESTPYKISRKGEQYIKNTLGK